MEQDKNKYTKCMIIAVISDVVFLLDLWLCLQIDDQVGFMPGIIMFFVSALVTIFACIAGISKANSQKQLILASVLLAPPVLLIIVYMGELFVGFLYG